MYLCCARPSLEQTLADKAPSPFSLKEFESYLRSNHCVESLEFYFDVMDYAKWLEKETRSGQLGETLLHERWNSIIRTYISIDAPKEVNITDEHRQKLSDLAKAGRLPPRDAETLATVVTFAVDTIRDSVYHQFVNEQNLCAVMGSSRLLANKSTLRSDSLAQADCGCLPVASSSTGTPSNSSSGSSSRRSGTPANGTGAAKAVPLIQTGSTRSSPLSSVALGLDSAPPVGGSAAPSNCANTSPRATATATGSAHAQKTANPTQQQQQQQHMHESTIGNSRSVRAGGDEYISASESRSARSSTDSITRHSTSSTTTQPSPRSQTFSDEGEGPPQTISIVEASAAAGNRNTNGFRLSFLHRDKSASGSDDERATAADNEERAWDKAGQKQGGWKKVSARIRKLYG